MEEEEEAERTSLTCECPLLALRRYCSPERKGERQRDGERESKKKKKELLSKGKAGFLDDEATDRDRGNAGFLQ